MVPFASDLNDDYVLPFDNPAEFTTSMAIRNPRAGLAAAVDVVSYDDAGVPIRLDQFTLNPRAHGFCHRHTLAREHQPARRGRVLGERRRHGHAYAGSALQLDHPFTPTSNLSRLPRPAQTFRNISHIASGKHTQNRSGLSKSACRIRLMLIYLGI
ncbi:MAG: hypothetical protein ACUVXB_17670 [Bryobacteraceae bacterium]